MKLPHLAVSILLAAALLPWLDTGQAGLLGLGSLFAGVLLRQRWRYLLLAFPFCLLWVFWRNTPGPEDLRTLLRPQAQSTHLRFQIMGDAEVLSFGPDDSELRVPVSVDASYQRGGWQEVRGRLQLRMPSENAPDFLTGTLWEAPGVLSPGNFSYVGLYRSSWKFTPDPGGLRQLDGMGGNHLLQVLFGVRASLSRRLNAACPDGPEIAGTLQALLLGKRAELEREHLQRFARTGLIHVFAISGLHLGLLAGMLILIGRRLGLSPRWMPAWVLPLLICFTLYTGLRASALRALIMITSLLMAPVFCRKPHVGNAFSLAVLVILVLAPGQLYDLGFQYSFLLVGSLLAFGRIFGEKVHIWFAGDPWAVPSPGSQWRARWLWPKVQGAAVVTLLCFVISAPLTAYNFNLFSPIGLLGNLLAVPLVFLLLATGFPALFSFALPTALSQICFLPARSCAAALLTWVAWLDRIPAGTQWVKAPPIWQLLMFYSLVGLWAWRPAKRMLWIGLLMGLASFAGTRAWLESRQPEIGMIDADRGQAFWLRLPGEGVLLLDTGSDWSGKTVTDALKRRGIDRIEALIFSHPDRHHVEGIRELQEVYTPRQIFIPAAAQFHPLFTGLIPRPEILTQGMQSRLAGWQVEVLHPPGIPKNTAADALSLVIRFSHGDQSVLWMGGAGESVTTALQDQYRLLPASWLLAGHPREGALWAEGFLQAVQPQSVLFSGENFEGISDARKAGEAEAGQFGSGILRVFPEGVLILYPEKATFKTHLLLPN